MPKQVRTWYEIFKKEGIPDRKALKDAIQRAYENDDITEKQADELEVSFKVASDMRIQVATRLLRIAKSLISKNNQKDYKFYVIVDGKIESGWEYKEDAQDQAKENLPPGKKGKVLTKTGVGRMGLNVDDDKDWG
jgi:hypothetical protein